MLFVIPTPLGNLQDITLRAKETLGSCDAIFCEDTRTTAHLLHLLNIPKQHLISYHAHNEKQPTQTALSFLREGRNIGLVSDAGTPCISDPGCLLVQAAYQEGFTVSALPGPSACSAALSMSGLLFSRFQFVGFLPRKEKEFEKELTSYLLPYRGITIAYESPERILETVQRICTLYPSWELVLIKELSKMHETVFRGSAKQLLEKLSNSSLKGEWVVLFSEYPHPPLPLDEALKNVKRLMNDCGLSLKSAVAAVALLHSLSKNQLYQVTLQQI